MSSSDIKRQQIQKEGKIYEDIKNKNEYKKPTDDSILSLEIDTIIGKPDTIIQQLNDEKILNRKIHRIHTTDLFSKFVDSVYQLMNNKYKNNQVKLVPFYSCSFGFGPPIDFKIYFYRLIGYLNHGKYSIHTLILSYIYVMNSPLHIDSYSIHRIYLVCLLLATKYNDDKYYNNKTFAKYGGVNTRELNGLEIDYLKRINYNLFIPYDYVYTLFENLLFYENQ